MQRHTTHYAAYDRYWTEVTPRMVAWFETYVRPRRDVVVTEDLEVAVMSVDLRIAGGTVVTPSGPVVRRPAGRRRADRRHRRRRRSRSPPSRVVDATGKHVLPGMIDVHVHTREPGFTHKEDILTDVAAGGCRRRHDDLRDAQPQPAHDVGADPRRGVRAVRGEVDRRLEPQPGGDPAGPDRTRWPTMGVNAYKIYMVVDTGRTYPHPAGTGMHGHGDLLQMMDTIAKTGKRFIIHPHDQSLMDYIERRVQDRGDNTPQGYAEAYAARDGVIWDTAIEVVLRLAEASGCPIHLAHMQTRRSIDAVKRARPTAST